MQDLSLETQKLLRRLYKQSQHHRVRQRAHCLLWSFQGMTTKELLKICSVDRITIYHWFDAWEGQHFVGLYDKQGRGRPPKLSQEEQNLAQQYVKQGYPRKAGHSMMSVT
jgi:transposase